jgi:hypothetical protein
MRTGQQDQSLPVVSLNWSHGSARVSLTYSVLKCPARGCSTVKERGPNTLRGLEPEVNDVWRWGSLGLGPLGDALSVDT